MPDYYYSLEKTESEFHFAVVVVVVLLRWLPSLLCVPVVPRTCRGVKKFRFSMGNISFIFRSQKTIRKPLLNGKKNRLEILPTEIFSYSFVYLNFNFRKKCFKKDSTIYFPSLQHLRDFNLRFHAL